MRQISSSSVFVVFTALLVLASFGTERTCAQASARLTGVVKDASGGTIEDALVTLTNEGTNVSRTTKTGNDGSYLFSLVDVGSYRLLAEHEGFKKDIHTGVTLQINQNARLDLTLEVGEATQTVEVSAAVAQVDTSGAVLGKVEDTRRIQDLPLVDRDTLQLGLLQAGVYTPDPDDGSGNPFNVSGQRSESLTFLVDGADNTDFLNNNIVVSPNPDAVAEFKILTNNYDAEFGRSSGGIVNQVIKSGTNKFHGTVFEFIRNDVLNARDYFLQPFQSKAAFKRNVFGGTVGAPIKKDKTFVFAAYQGARRREGEVSSQLTVLSQKERAGDFGELCPPSGGVSGFDANGICQNSSGTQLINPGTGNPYSYNKIPVNPISAKYIAKYLPLPQPGTDGSSNAYQFAATKAIDEDQGILRVDHNLSKRDVLSGVYLADDVREDYPFIVGKGASTGGNLPVGSGFTTKYRDQVASATWTRTFDRGWLNEVRISANRTATAQDNPTDKTTPASLGFTNVNPDDPRGVAPPIMYVSGFNIGPSPQGPTTEHNMVFQEQDHLTIPRGRHEWKFGGDVRRVQNNFNYDFYNNGSYDFGLLGIVPGNGTFTGSSFADFVGGFPDNYYQSSNAVYGIRTSSFYFYGQDTLKIHPRLTLVLGVRYEYNTPQHDIHNNILGYFGPTAQSKVFPNAPPGILYPGDPGTPNKSLINPDRNNFAPRLGFAWDILGNSKLVMRGGFGIFYDIQDGALNLQFGGQPPFGDISSLNFTAAQVSSTSNFLADPFTPLGITNPYPFRANGNVGKFFTPRISFAYVTDPKFRTPYSENYNYGFQYQMTKDTAIEAVYVGSLGRKLISTVDVNPPQPQIERQMLANGIPLNIDCSRLLSGCINPTTDPNATLQNIGQLLTNKSTGMSASHEFQFTVDKRYSRGLSFRAAYTFGKTTDLTSGFRSRSGTYTDPFYPALDHALADFDVRHRFVLSASWELPIGRTLREKWFVNQILGGWQANVIATFQGGTPFTLYSKVASSGQGNGLERPNLVGPIKIFDPRRRNTFTSNCGGGGTGNYWFDPSAFDCHVTGELGSLASFGNFGRNVLRGPGINNWDISFLKRFKVTESKNFEFRAEMFNAFNHVQFLNPDNNGNTSTFGMVSTTRGPRLMQFGLKFYY